MKHIWSSALFLFAVGCATEPVDGGADLLPDEEGGGGDSGGGGGEASTAGCEIGVRLDGALDRLARGGKLDLRLEDAAPSARPRVVSSSAPELLRVVQTAAGATITGVAPGTAALEVWRCDRRIASYPVTVVQVADVEVRLSFGAAGRSEPLHTLVGLASGSADQLEVTYFDDQHVALPGRGAASFTFEGGLQPARSISLALTDDSDGIPREVVPIAIGGAGRFLAITDALEVDVDVTTTPAPAELELELVELPLAGAYALEARGTTADGQPIAGLAPAFTVAPAAAFTQLPTEPRSSQLLLIGQPQGTVTFTADVAGVTTTLTVTFP